MVLILLLYEFRDSYDQRVALEIPGGSGVRRGLAEGFGERRWMQGVAAGHHQQRSGEALDGGVVELRKARRVIRILTFKKKRTVVR